MKKEPNKYDSIREQVQEMRQLAATAMDEQKATAARIELAALAIIDEVNKLDETVSDCAACWCNTCTSLYCCPRTPADFNFDNLRPYPCTGCERGQRHKPIAASRCPDYVRENHDCQNCLCSTCALLLTCPNKPDGARGWFDRDGTLWPCEHCPEGLAHCAADVVCGYGRYISAGFPPAEG
ncbi:MAG: hypothetical protein RR998_08455 [Oscillospiraceae bacterium]